MVEAVERARVVRRSTRRARTACASAPPGARRSSGATRSGASDATAGCGNSRPITDAGSIGGALLAAELVEARLEQRLDRRRHRDLARSSSARTQRPSLLRAARRCRQHRQHLLDVQRVAFGGRDDARHDVGRQAGRAEQVGDDLRRRVVAQRAQHERGATGALAPLRALLEQVVARGARAAGSARSSAASSTCSSRSRNAGSAQWMSSTARPPARRAAQRLEELARRPEDLVQRERRRAQARSPTARRVGDVGVADAAPRAWRAPPRACRRRGCRRPRRPSRAAARR